MTIGPRGVNGLKRILSYEDAEKHYNNTKVSRTWAKKDGVPLSGKYERYYSLRKGEGGNVYLACLGDTPYIYYYETGEISIEVGVRRSSSVYDFVSRLLCVTVGERASKRFINIDGLFLPLYGELVIKDRVPVTPPPAYKAVINRKKAKILREEKELASFCNRVESLYAAMDKSEETQKYYAEESFRLAKTRWPDTKDVAKVFYSVNVDSAIVVAIRACYRNCFSRNSFYEYFYKAYDCYDSVEVPYGTRW